MYIHTQTHTTTWPVVGRLTLTKELSFPFCFCFLLLLLAARFTRLIAHVIEYPHFFCVFSKFDVKKKKAHRTLSGFLFP